MSRSHVRYAHAAWAATLLFTAGAHAQPANDSCLNAIPISAGSVTPFNTQAATRDGVASCMNFSAARDIWFTYTCTSAEHVVLDLCGSGSMVKGLAVFSGGCGGTQLACNRTGGCGTGQPQLAFDTPGAGTYHIYLATLQSSGDFSGILTLNATPLAGLPTRDSCANAYPVGGVTTAPFDTAGLTTDGAASCGGLNDGWFVWMPNKTGVATVTTCGLTTGDTVLSAYSSCGGTQLACNDNACGTASSITFSATFGVPVWIRVASNAGQPVSGQLSFSVSLTPSNDLCQNALALPGLGGYQVDTTFATTQGPAASCARVGDAAESKDLFFKYTAGNEGYITVDTLLVGGTSTNPSTVDTTLQVFDGCGGSELACNDDANALTLASKTCPVPVTPGASYIIRVATRGSGGSFLLRVAAASAPTWSMPADAIAEPGDPCSDWVDDLNNGCDVQTGELRRTPIRLCQNYKGTAPSRTTLNPYGVLVHDADMYTFTLVQPSIVTITGQARFRVYGSVSSGMCGSFNFATPSASVSPCSGVGDFSLTLRDVMPPGVYNFVIANDFDLNATCGINDEYWFRITTSNPCPPTCVADIAGLGGSPGPDGDLTADDVITFIAGFFASQSISDVAGLGGQLGADGQWTVDDVIAFLNAFFGGCP
jgi:hypothetical protein